MIDRRRALSLAAVLGILLLPLVAKAQQAAKVPRIGVVRIGSPPDSYADALRRGLAELGWIEGRNILIEYRYAEGRTERYPAFMTELIGLKVDVIVASAGSVYAAKQATSTIPVVFPAVSDPVAAGLVASLARPGGNITGHAQLDTETTAKRIELLTEISPKLKRVAVLRSSEIAQIKVQGDVMEAAARSTARSLGLQMQVLSVSRIEELDDAFTAARGAGAEALLVGFSALFTANRQRLVELAAQHRLIAVYEHRDFADAGGLLSYGPNFEELFRSTAKYVDKILKGAKPADLPVEQPTRFDLVVNLRTAKALQLKIPQTLLVRADQVIQ